MLTIADKEVRGGMANADNQYQGGKGRSGECWQSLTRGDKLHMTQFEIECRFGGHSVTKKFKTILQILLAKPKLWKKFIFL